MKSEKPIFAHEVLENQGLREGYLAVGLPTEYPSVALGDLMNHTRAKATREDKDEIQDVGPRLRQGDILNKFPEYTRELAHAYDENAGENLHDPQYEAEYVDPDRREHDGEYHGDDHEETKVERAEQKRVEP